MTTCTARATITFEPLIAGERVMKFGLLPNLRVTRVTRSERARTFISCRRAARKTARSTRFSTKRRRSGQEHSITVEYEGDKVLTNAGDGSFYVSARSSWYPNLNGFGEKALYDLTFKVPKGEVVISVGKLEGQSTEAGFAVTTG